MMNEATGDESIVGQVLAGDTEAFATLITRHKHMVFATVARHVPGQEVEEVAQEVFIRAYQSLASFRGKSQFKTWLNTITVRACHDFWRKRYRSREVSESTLGADGQNWLEERLTDPAESRMEDPEHGQVLHWALGRLSAAERMVVQLVYFEERSIRDAAKLLGLSAANVKIRAFRARGKLKKLLMEMEGES